MLRLTVSTEEYLMIGEDIRIVFLGGSRNHLRIMVDAPKDVDVVRSRVIENRITDPEERAKLPKYHAEPELPERFRRPKKVVITHGNAGSGGQTAGESADKPLSGQQAAGR